MASDPNRCKFCNKDAFGSEHRELLRDVLQESCKNHNNITVIDFAFVSTRKPRRIK
jgi:hypothetical protein